VKLFIPAVGYRIRLVKDWSFDLYNEHRNDSLLKVYDPSDESKESKIFASMPQGTVLEVDRVYVRNANKSATEEDDHDSVTFKLIEHPTLPSKPRVRFWAKLSDVNNIEFELPENYSEGKDKARESAKKPKKLTFASIKALIDAGIHSVIDEKHASYYGDPPAWMNETLSAQMSAVKEEYIRCKVPFDKEHHEKRQAEHRKELQLAFEKGTLNLPVGVAGKVTSFDDIVNVGSYADAFKPFSEADTRALYLRQRPSSFLYYDVINNSEPKKVVKSKASDGRWCREFRCHNQHLVTAMPFLTRFWVKVFSDEDDQTIVCVEAGFDKDES